MVDMPTSDKAMVDMPTSDKATMDRPGFALTLSVIIAAAVTTVVVITTALLSSSQIDNTSQDIFGLFNTLQAESCTQEALARLQSSATYAGGSLAAGDCTATVTTTANEAYIMVTSTWNTLYSRTMFVTTTRPTVRIIEWDS